jgi:hypothetical protein
MKKKQEIIARIRENAALVVSLARDQLGLEISYDESGVSWLDGFIQRQHEDGISENQCDLVSTLGALLGECIIRIFGGDWAMIDGEWGVQFDNRNAAFPFDKVRKQLENGAADSVLSFFTAIPHIFKNKLA